MYYIFGEPAGIFFGRELERANALQVDEELRGWLMETPNDRLSLPMYVVAAKYCPTLRDVYMQYVKKQKIVLNKPMLTGRMYHEVMSQVIPMAKKYIYQHGVSSDFNLLEHMTASGSQMIEKILVENSRDIKILFKSGDFDTVKENMQKLWNFQAVQIVASVDLVLSKFSLIDADSLVSKAIPISVEQKTDGSRIGLSNQLSIDAMQVPQTVIMDVKTGKEQSFHSLTVAGYALAYESENMKPVNLGCIIYPHFLASKSVPYVTKKFFLIDNTLRLELLEERKRKANIIKAGIDPGLPEDKTKCPTCGYFSVCYPGGIV
ncbi:MAG: type I-A CRISPR-associated protein Cas4/Csa1 [Candidatus Aenigmatarchaeota archaeon]